MDRLIREANPPTGQLASPKPQYKKPGVDEYEPVEGQHGAPFAILKDASGNIVSPATENKLEQVRQLLAGVATEAKLEQARGLLASISGKDFATQATLAQVQSELALVKAELQEIKANQLSGDQKVQLSGTVVEQLITHNAVAITDTSSYGVNVDTSRFREFTIWARSTLDTDCNVMLNIIGAGTGNLRFYEFDHEEDKWVALDARRAVVPGDQRAYNLSSFFNHSFKSITGIRLIARCEVAPTKGSITIWLEGELR